MTAAEADWPVVPLNSKVHDRAAFSCGAPELDRYIRDFASQDVKRDVARVFVALDRGSSTVAGYYSLSAARSSKQRHKTQPHEPFAKSRGQNRRHSQQTQQNQRGVEQSGSSSGS